MFLDHNILNLVIAEALCHVSFPDMATASCFFSDDEFQCSICTDFFTNPVSLPCGHNFCKNCITYHWKDKEQYQCPLCKKEFNKSVELCVNTLFREIVDNYKQDYIPRHSEKPTNPQDVPCDYCSHSRRKAAKTCLVCLASYCKAHLKPHTTVATLKSHTLTDPVPNLEERICTKHNRILEEVCSNDPTPVCALCAHSRTKSTVPLEKKCEDEKAQPEKQYEDAHYIKPNSSKKRKTTKNSKTSSERKKNNPDEAFDTDQPSVTEDSVNLGDVYIWFNQQFYTFRPISVKCGFSRGRFYYDVHINDNNRWELGVVSEKMHGKRIFSHNTHGRWIMRLGIHLKCTKGCPIDSTKLPGRVLVCVDYEQGYMFLCHPLNGLVMFSFMNCSFSGKLFLFSRDWGPSVDCTQDSTHNTTLKFAVVLFVFIVLFRFIYFVCVGS